MIDTDIQHQDTRTNVCIAGLTDRRHHEEVTSQPDIRSSSRLVMRPVYNESREIKFAKALARSPSFLLLETQS